MSAELSDYEKLRAANIKVGAALLAATAYLPPSTRPTATTPPPPSRTPSSQRNAEVMKALGLDSTDFALHAAHKRKAAGGGGGGGGKKKATKRKRDPAEAAGPARRSARLVGAAAERADGLQDGEGEGGASGGDGDVTYYGAPLHASEEEHAAAEAAHNARWAGQQKGVTMVGTASYQHTLMRVRTMTEKKLDQRIRTIERAKVRPRFSLATTVVVAVAAAAAAAPTAAAAAAAAGHCQ